MRIPASLLIPSLAFTSIAASGAVAAADEPVRAPFVSMDDTADASKIEADLSFVAFDFADDVELTLGRLELRGQYVSPSGLGGYAGITASSIISQEDDFDADDDFGIGNLEVGGLYQRALSAQADIGLRLGLVLPTATDQGGGFVNLLAGSVVRPSDLATGYADHTWLRLGVSPTFHQDGLFLRADLGVDLVVDGPDGDSIDSLLHANLGAGYATSDYGVAIELQNVREITDEDDDPAWAHELALSARLGGQVAPFISASTPLDGNRRGDAFSVTVGLTSNL